MATHRVAPVLSNGLMENQTYIKYSANVYDGPTTCRVSTFGTNVYAPFAPVVPRLFVNLCQATFAATFRPVNPNCWRGYNGSLPLLGLSDRIRGEVQHCLRVASNQHIKLRDWRVEPGGHSYDRRSVQEWPQSWC